MPKRAPPQPSAPSPPCPLEQHVFIVRHGDKYSSYPACGASSGENGTLCFDAELMGNNPPLTPCGLQQADETASFLINASRPHGGIRAVISSPFLRCLETALALAKQLGLRLQVEQAAGEARADEGPFRPYNAALDTGQLEEVANLWDRSYGSAPIPTPEGDAEYWRRVRRLAAAVRLTLRTSPEVAAPNVAVYTHATTSVSLAYGLCHGDAGTDATLRRFVEARKAIGPGGVIHVTLDAATGACKSAEQTQNVAYRCGLTGPHKCAFEDYPGWYWEHAEGRGPGQCS